jgi:hypothetical protein
MSSLWTVQNTMPLQILDGETPATPPWGSILLDIYLLAEWDTPHPSHLTESPSDRRRRLVRQFLALGHEGREVYTSYPWIPFQIRVSIAFSPN